jgi:hypothetical protein
MGPYRDIPESEEVRAEHHRRFNFGIRDELEKARDWWADLSMDDAVKWYFLAILACLVLTTIGSGIKTLMQWCITFHHIEESKKIYGSLKEKPHA